LVNLGRDRKSVSDIILIAGQAAFTSKQPFVVAVANVHRVAGFSDAMREVWVTRMVA
jgi:hypothetical protein